MSATAAARHIEQNQRERGCAQVDHGEFVRRQPQSRTQFRKLLLASLRREEREHARQSVTKTHRSKTARARALGQVWDGSDERGHGNRFSERYQRLLFEALRRTHVRSKIHSHNSRAHAVRCALVWDCAARGPRRRRS
jgi:hypothetical protein